MESIQIIVVATVVAALVARLILRALPSTFRRSLWWASRPPKLSDAGAMRAVVVCRRTLARVIAWPAGSPLSIKEFSSQAKEIEGLEVTDALRAAIGRMGATRYSSVDIVTAQLNAHQIIDEVADALSVAPQGKWISAMLRLASVLTGRRMLQLNGSVFDSDQRGPGLALSLTRPTGSVIDSTTMWAVDYEPTYDRDLPCRDSKADRMLRLAIAGAVWTHFTYMADRRALRRDDFGATLGTIDWQSYASQQIAVDEQRVATPRLTRARFALAVDRDPHNLLAQFDLARLEAACGGDEEKNGARQRLHWVHRALDNQLRGHGAKRSPRSRTVNDRRLLGINPLHYQVMHQEAALAINGFLAEHPSESVGPDAAKALQGTFVDLTEDLVNLEKTLALLRRPHAKDLTLRGRLQHRWAAPFCYSREGNDLYRLLRRLEGPLLALWLILDLHVHGANGRHPDAGLRGRDVTEARKRVIRVMVERSEHPGSKVKTHPRSVILGYLKYYGHVGLRTRYNLACYFADLGDDPAAWRELRRTVEDRRHLRMTADDPELAALRRRDPEQWAEVMGLYGQAEGLARFGAIGVKHACRLREIGIEGVQDLAHLSRTAHQRKRLASSLGVATGLVDRWSHLADLACVLSASPEEMNLLERAGLADTQELRKLQPARLVELAGAAASDGAGSLAVDEKLARRWIESVS